MRPLKESRAHSGVNLNGMRSRRQVFCIGSTAAGELAVLVLEHERSELLERIVDVALVHDPVGRELHVAHLVLHVPALHVEHAVDIDLPVRAARRPSSNCAVNGGIAMAASTALLLKASAYCVNGSTLTSTSLMVSSCVSS